jgi:hypothetical protein
MKKGNPIQETKSVYWDWYGVKHTIIHRMEFPSTLHPTNTMGGFGAGNYGTGMFPGNMPAPIAPINNSISPTLGFDDIELS